MQADERKTEIARRKIIDMLPYKSFTLKKKKKSFIIKSNP